jgi:poly(3-hydroxybutyrate) depolymerase
MTARGHLGALSCALALVALLLVVASARTAAADEPPCKGCRLTLPPPSQDGAKVPLLVVLHGDHQATATPHDAWTRLAVKRGIGVLTLACPADLGCKGSYWQWDGDPAWVSAQLAKVEETRPLDRDRLWIAGWSGGATWLGMHAQSFARTFAATVIHGGGLAPRTGGCGDTKASVYFLVGNQNPLHHLAVNLRDHYRTCDADLTWDLLPGADHGGEWAALGSHGTKIVDWLLAHPRGKNDAGAP